MALSSVDKLLEIMRRLRDPETGCDWDKAQTSSSIAPYTIEEAYEVVDAVLHGTATDLCEELGDLLFHVVFHAEISSEQGLFSFDDVANSIVEKMERRHPHIFSNKKFSSEAEKKQAWEAEKARERRAKSTQKENTETALTGIAQALPALIRADKIQKRASNIGFDWTEIPPVFEKVSEELQEVHEAFESGDKDHQKEEVGDLLFSVVNLARHLNIDSEEALRAANQKFTERFQLVEKQVAEKQQRIQDLSYQALDQYWEQAKQVLKKSQ